MLDKLGLSLNLSEFTFNGCRVAIEELLLGLVRVFGLGAIEQGMRRIGARRTIDENRDTLRARVQGSKN